MSANRFSLHAAMIVLLAISLAGAGCASLRPPALETGQAVDEEVAEALHIKELEGNEPPEAVQVTLAVVAEVIVVLGRMFAGY